MDDKKITGDELDEMQDILRIKRQRVRKEQYQSGISEAKSAMSYKNRAARGDTGAGSSSGKGKASPIMRQSAKNRRMRQREVPEDLENLHRGEGKQSFRIKKPDKSRFRVFLRNAIICLVLYAIIMPTSYFLFQKSLKPDMSGENKNIVYQLGGDSNIFLRKSISRSRVFINDTIYLNMSELAEYCTMTITGDSEQLRFIIRDGSNENVRFVIGSDEVKINNVSARISAPTFISDDDLYVPMDFVNLYVVGVKATYDENKGKITVEDDSEIDGISFALKDPVPTESISWESLSYDIREYIMNGDQVNSGSSVTDINNQTVTSDSQQN